jgi:hypothetical protein
MDLFTKESKQKDNSSTKIMVGALVAAIAIVLAVIGILYLRPSEVDIQQKTLDSALRAGNPEFELLTKKIVISTDENRLMESPTAMGSIMMSIGGRLKNLTGKTLTLVEINVAVVDMSGKAIKDKNIVVIPKQAKTLADREELPMTVVIEGFKKEDVRANFRWKVIAIKTE